MFEVSVRMTHDGICERGEDVSIVSIATKIVRSLLVVPVVTAP